MRDDIYFMTRALALARRAMKHNEIPIGAVVVHEDDIIGRGYNQSESKKCQAFHAEMIAIEKACKKLGDFRLYGCTLYVTLEPCLMCMGLIGLSRIERMVYATESPLFGYHLDKESLPDLYKKHIAGVSTGVLKDEAAGLLKQFFKEKRKKGE